MEIRHADLQIEVEDAEEEAYFFKLSKYAAGRDRRVHEDG